MNRRNFLAASMALAGQHKLLRSMGTLPITVASTAPAGPPRNLLSNTYTPSFLASKLAPPGEWHPYPRWNERGPWDAVPSDLRAAIIEQAEIDQKAGWPQLLATGALDFQRTGDRTRYDSKSLGRRSQLEALVVAECLEAKGRFLDDIANGVWLICEESFWGVPAHLGMQRAGVGLPDITEPIIELFGAETVQLLAWTKYLVGEQLNHVSPMIGKRIEIESERRILKPARERNDFWWMGFGANDQTDRLNNWTPWINSNLMVANLLLEQDPKLRLLETSRILKSLDAYLNQYWPDAGEEEGPQYFSASVMFYYEAVSLIESATGSSTNVFSNPFLDAMARYIMNAHVVGDDFINYGDAHVHAAPAGDLIYRFGKAAHDQELEAFGAYCASRNGFTKIRQSSRGISLPNMSRSLPALLHATELRNARREDVMVRDVWYPVLGLVTARVKANSADGMYFAVLAANNGRSHSHNDTGSYIIYQDGEPVAIDVGVEAYTSKTFGPERYGIWTMQSAYHNLPTIGGVMQHDGVNFRATDLKYDTNNERARFSFNIAAAYPKSAGVTSWVRTVTLDRKLDRITVEENFELVRPVPVSLSIMTPRLVTPGADGSITLKLASGEGKDSMLKYDATQLSPHVETIPLADEELRESWGKQIYRLLLNSKQPIAKGSWHYQFARA